MNLRRTLVLGIVALSTVLGLFGSVTAARADTAVVVPPVPVVTASAASTSAPVGQSVSVTAVVVGALPGDDVVVGIKTDDGWVELDRRAATEDPTYTFAVSPSTLGPHVYRVGVLRAGALVAWSAAVRVAGTIAVNPDPVVRGETATLSGVLPQPVARPVGLQLKANGAWKLVDADFSAADGSIAFTLTATATVQARFVAPARTIDGVDYPAQASAPVTVRVVEPVEAITPPAVP